MNAQVTKPLVVDIEEDAPLTWESVAGLVEIRADGSWVATDLARRVILLRRSGAPEAKPYAGIPLNSAGPTLASMFL